MRVDVMARKWGGPDGGPDGMAIAISYFARQLCELGHSVRCYRSDGNRPPPWTHERAAWRMVAPLIAPDDWGADLIVTVIAPTWARTVRAASDAGALGRLVYWHHHGGPVAASGALAIMHAPAIVPPRDWPRAIMLAPSSWAAETGEGRTGDDVLIAGCSALKGARTSLRVAQRLPDVRFLAVRGRGTPEEIRAFESLRNVTVTPGPMRPVELLARARVLLLPTLAEVHPLLVVEAAARGIPVVCSDLPGCRAAAGAAGVYLPPNAAPDRWVDTVRRALSDAPAPVRLRLHRDLVAGAIATLREWASAPPPPRVESRRPVASRSVPIPVVPAIQSAPIEPDPAWRHRPVPSRPRVLVIADVRTWAWHKKATALRRYLSDRFEIEIAYSCEREHRDIIAAQRYDLIHTFEVHQLGKIPAGYPVTSGITAHVWQTWGADAMRAWSRRCVAFHANSLLLVEEMLDVLGREIAYVPNGVDHEFYRRTRPRDSDRLVVGFVGKPNPRKGADIVREACRLARVELRTVERTHRDAHDAEEMRDFYQGLHVLAVASDMDGTPNPALEAAACECAIVSNRIGNMPEFIDHGRNGLLTERTVESLAAALADLAARPIAEVEATGRAARTTVEREWTWSKQAEHYADMWRAALAGAVERAA